MIEVLLERPRVVSAKVEHGWDLPANTFGAAYARFMGSRNFSPYDRPPVRFMDTEELAYVAMRFNAKQRKLFYQHYFPWAVRAGMQCNDLMCVYYEQHFHEDLEDVRRKLAIVPALAESVASLYRWYTVLPSVAYQSYGHGGASNDVLDFRMKKKKRTGKDSVKAEAKSVRM
ncbi:hypothetical protein Fmac_003147 [Flemingia macrophylla]|uniref:Uncharacterized protein n=1 Tax=Flemingia macrophylla TaxID=520843 RepID=A0ABD1NM03_9FABA